MSQSVDSFGLPFDDAATTVTTPIFGRRRSFAGLLLIEWMFVAVSSVNISATLALTSYRLYIVIDSGHKGEADFTLCILLIINACFCAFYVIHGVLKELKYEIYAFMAAIVCVLVYCIIDFFIVNNRQDIRLARLIAGCILAPINLVVAFLVAQEFGWLEFRIVGASTILQRMYEDVCRFTSFLRFDFQIAASLVILVLQDGTDIETRDIYALGIGLPFLFLWMILGFLVVRKEWKWMSWVIFIFGLVQPAYVLYKIYTVYEVLGASEAKSRGSEEILQYAILVASALSLLVRMIVFFELFHVTTNFGEGLTERAGVDERTDLLHTPSSRANWQYTQ